MSAHTCRIVVLLGIAIIPPSVRPACASQPVTVEVRETAGIRRFQYPVAVKLQLAEPVPRATPMRLLLDGRPVLAQFQPAEEGDPVGAWWLDFPVDLLPRQSMAYRVEFGARLAPGPTRTRGHRLTESDSMFHVVNEPAIAWSLDRRLDGLLRSVRSGELEYLRPNSMGLFLIDRSGNEHAAGGSRDGYNVTVRVIRNSPLAVGIRFIVHYGNEKLAGVRSTVDLVFPVFKSWVEVDWRVADPRGKLAGLGAQLDMNLDEPARGAATLVDFGAPSLVYARLHPGEVAMLQSVPDSAGSHETHGGSRPEWEILRGPSGRLEPFVSGPVRIDPDATPEGWVHVMDRRRCLALAVDQFARESADRISVSAEGSVRLDRRLSIDDPDPIPGERRLRLWLHFIPFPPQQTAATSPQSMQIPPVIRVRVGDALGVPER